MSYTFKSLLAAALIPAALIGSAQADVLAFTDFNDRTLTGESTQTATHLNWVLNGLDDPGDMTALKPNATAQTIADGNALMQDIFAPFVNTGNGNTFWTTDISLTPSGGSVTLTDVSFVYVPFSGSQVLNVSRESDFIVTLLDPSLSEVESVLVFATGGTGLDPETPTLTATFTAPIELSLPGTYTLRIKGGDLFTNDDPVLGPPLGTKNETGNHTAIDDLSINGTLGGSALPGDTNGDNDVDDSDLGTSFANYTGPIGDVGKTPAEGDTDGDGDVDDSDLGTSFANYTGPLGPASVPEPTSMALLGLGGFALIRRRRV